MAKAKKSAVHSARSQKERPSATTGSKKTDMVVVVSGGHPVDQVASELKNAGFEVDQVLHAINQVTGRAAPDLKPRLRRIEGVEDVSDAHEPFNIGPPGSPIS
jgi:hypothetical protein